MAIEKKYADAMENHPGAQQYQAVFGMIGSLGKSVSKSQKETTTKGKSNTLTGSVMAALPILHEAIALMRLEHESVEKFLEKAKCHARDVCYQVNEWVDEELKLAEIKASRYNDKEKVSAIENIIKGYVEVAKIYQKCKWKLFPTRRQNRYWNSQTENCIERARELTKEYKLNIDVDNYYDNLVVDCFKF